MNKFISERNKLLKENKEILRSRISRRAICPYCNVIMHREAENFYLSAVTIDHIRPIAQGGTDKLENLIAVCKNCNQAKSDLDEVLLFRLNYPQVLTQQEFLTLNDIVNISHRITIEEKMIELIQSGDLIELVEMINMTKKTTTKYGYFTRSLCGVRHIINKHNDYKTQSEKAIEFLRIKINTQKENLRLAQEKVSKINFTSYSLIPCFKIEADAKKAA